MQWAYNIWVDSRDPNYVFGDADWDEYMDTPELLTWQEGLVVGSPSFGAIDELERLVHPSKPRYRVKNTFENVLI